MAVRGRIRVEELPVSSATASPGETDSAASSSPPSTRWHFGRRRHIMIILALDVPRTWAFNLSVAICERLSLTAQRTG